MADYRAHTAPVSIVRTDPYLTPIPEDAALFKTTDGGKTWKELPKLRSSKGDLWQPGAGGMCLHTIILDPKNEKRIYIAISAAGAFRTDDGGLPVTWRWMLFVVKKFFETRKGSSFV